MLLPKKNRIMVYTELFKEGVLVAKKDTTKPKHDTIDVPNLHVMKLMLSLKSRGYVRETFSWQWYYWYLTEEGIEYLREYLHLPEEIVPATHKKAQTSRPARPAGARDYDAYKGGKDGGPGHDFKPNFRGGREDGYRRDGGFGRGAGGF
mmetsp:Transcript_1237/g.1464  ORF Transcript_1237/g.1464 Transcript_1237/m.1464 type:complete len:149 (-) Transcript_1237:212-658(-)